MTENEKQRLTGDEEIIKELCVSNGLCHEKVCQEGSGEMVLEMFFSGFPRMVGLSLFPRLSSLTIVGQSISSIQGLEYCPLLKELWVVECKLNEISGLHNCVHLQKLFLYDNNIQQITNLEMLVDLQVLWLNKNQISDIQGLNSLVNLKELNLADNAIESLGHSLDPNINLQDLNLSGNKISSFKELTHLARLPRLRHLSLKDPQSVPNPLCLLYNYYIHVLYHMPHLQRLDTYDISSKHLKDTAESTVLKKMMYYTMRVRCAQRQFDELKAKLRQQRRNQIQIPEEKIRVLTHMLRNMECELSLVQSAGKKSGEPEDLTSDLRNDHRHEQKLQHKLDALKDRLTFWEQRLKEVEAGHQHDVALASDRRDMMVHFLLLELETVGNIRFEEGNTGEPWFTSCYDLLLSRFCAWDYKPYHITGIKINRIIRIHNRALRQCFQDKVHALLCRQEPSPYSQNYKRCMEYLFYVPDPEHSCESDEILQILENGFKTADAYKALGRERAVPLSNSVSLSDRLRMTFIQKKSCSTSGSSPEDPLPFRHGQLIISKVFLGRSAAAKEGLPIDCDHYPKANSVYLSTCSKEQEHTAQTAPDTLCPSSLLDSCDCRQRQKLWYMFDHEMVLPEYLVDFEYVTQDTSQPDSPDSPSSSHASPADAPSVSRAELDLDEDALNLEPILKPHPKLLSLDEKSILAVARANVLSQITVLNLHGNSLNKLPEISRLTALKQLALSFNEFTHLDDVSHMPNLEYLDVSFNHISSLEGLRGLGRLIELDLRWNQLTRIRDDMNILRKHTPALLRLDTRHNPWHRNECVRMVVLGRLKTLTHLDDVLVMEEEAAAAVQVAARSRINQASLMIHSRTDSERPRSLSLLSSAHLLTQISPSPWKHSQELESGWTTKITALNLDGLRLTRLSNLDRLVNLRWASFDNNELTRIEGLEHCPLLEELSLNNNSISRLEGLCAMHRLTRLSINSNHLQYLDGDILDQLPNLHFLSVENNIISSLHGLQRSRSLFELYVGNNDISTTRDIYHLKALSSLIILDLYGNPLVNKLENYRIYMVFHLPSLKALDGVAVETCESETAKDVFGGRLNADMVAEKLGHTNYRDLSELNLQSSSVRMVDLTPADLFSNLRSINLERNNLTSFSGLIFLPNLKVLSLNYNHIESILPRQKVQSHMSNKQVLYHKVSSSGYGQQNSRPSREGLTDNLEPLMSSLEVLHLGYNGISNLINLQISRLTNLKALFLQGNDISQVDGLDGLRRLRELVLDRNRIKSLSENSFCGQGVLLDLHLAENRIRELNHLQPLTELRRLFLDMNKIQDISELEKLEVLPSLIELSVVGNPVARRSLHRPAVVLHLSTLQVLDGMTVTLEERTRAELLNNEAQSSSSGGEITLPGLVPLVTRPAPLRGAGTHTLVPDQQDDTHDVSRYKKQKAVVSLLRGVQSDFNFRQVRGSSNHYMTALQQTGYRVLSTFSNTDPETRYQCHSGPRPPPPPPL
ncbi:leucine-rich repeat-containing protein 9 [Labeo rohita]|uniref:leucine-rich repeat-containing protein 9 n=1 Tax=Labeo rohita TaxID=84645 RepID=UPI0021E23107|nr:leucine-rich repeat-containing protein 9 [Labeo rohita]XP_050982868.1 leucine-rich repeat-containing protein 9 [Labeo rohita]